VGDYTTMLIPRELKEKIKYLAEREGKAQWRVLEEAIGLIYADKTKPRIKESLSWMDKVSWYIIKIAMSVGAFKENPSDDNLKRLEATASQVAERLKLPYNSVAMLLRLARQYRDAHGKGDRALVSHMARELNMALKMIVIDIMNATPEETPEEIE